MKVSAGGTVKRPLIVIQPLAPAYCPSPPMIEPFSLKAKRYGAGPAMAMKLPCILNPSVLPGSLKLRISSPPKLGG